MSTTVLASGIADKEGEQDKKLETLACHLANSGKTKLSQIMVQMLVTAWLDDKRWNSWKKKWWEWRG